MLVERLALSCAWIRADYRLDGDFKTMVADGLQQAIHPSTLLLICLSLYVSVVAAAAAARKAESRHTREKDIYIHIYIIRLCVG